MGVYERECRPMGWKCDDLVNACARDDEKECRVGGYWVVSVPDERQGVEVYQLWRLEGVGCRVEGFRRRLR